MKIDDCLLNYILFSYRIMRVTKYNNQLEEKHMSKKLNLTEGNISTALTKLALPIMGTSLINMLYNLTDMMWLGRLSTNAVAGAGTVGFFLWFAVSLAMISQVGVGIGVSQAYGKDNMDEARSYVSNAIKLDLFIAIIYSLSLFIFRHKIIGFFNLGDFEVIQMALDYLVIICFGLVFHFINPVLSGIFNASGNSLTPFIINSIGLVVNMILDPLLIFGFGPFPAMAIKGAALATVLAQVVVTSVFLVAASKNKLLFSQLNLLKLPELKYIKRIFKLGFPASMQSCIHASISMIIAKILAGWGPMAIAVQSVGSQIESISWMTAEGFSTAISVFVGQNFGSRNYDRVKEGYYKGLRIVTIIGTFSTILFVFGAEPIFRIFIPDDPIALEQGAIYLRILGLSQIFMCMEIASAGAFNGIGRTLPPALTGITLNSLRIPAALILSSYAALGLSGIWWSISVTSIFKGIILTSLCIYTLRKSLNE